MKYKNDDEFIEVYLQTVDTSKISTKRLFNIVKSKWPEQLWNIFDPKDDCFCSSVSRKRYKDRFRQFYTTTKI